MTTKRFTTRNGVFYTDTQTGYEFQCYGEVADLLNELAEENQHLKGVLKEFKEALKELKEIGDYQAMRIKELQEENQQYKALLQDMGLLMSDEDVMCIRREIADKFIKQLYKENGFDVDVDCIDGFKIIPKGDVE